MNLNYRTIVAIGQPELYTKEGAAGVALYPGTFVLLAATGADVRYADGDQDIRTWAQDTYNQQATAGATGEVLIVMEEDYVGSGVETQIASGTKIRVYDSVPGDVLNVRFTGTGGGTNINKGTQLSFDGTGSLRAVTGSDTCKFVAEENIVLAAGITNLFRCRRV